MLKLILDKAISQSDLNKYKSRVSGIHNSIHSKTSLGSDFLGWVTYPNDYDKNEYNKMKEVASKIQKKVDYLVVIGIGGSYLGSRAAIEMINGIYNKDQKVQVVYAGHTMSSTYTQQLLNFLSDKKFAICVISKSGTTTEASIGFRLFQKLLIKNTSLEKSKELIVCVTDANKGNLRELANKNGYVTFNMPEDIGGRFSVLTPVGIFPMMVAGIDTDKIFEGAKKAASDLSKESNSAYDYALARFFLHKDKKYPVELLVSYELQMQYFNEWWKQLFGESEGKQDKGLFPASCLFSTDLHSLGQFIQEGSKVLFETIVTFKKPTLDIKMFSDKDNLDGLNYLEKRTLNEINYIAQKGVLDAHKIDGQVPNIIIEAEEMNAKTYGYLVYWFFKSCAMSAYLLDVNPFDQPGVEIYKKNMFKLLGKK